MGNPKICLYFLLCLIACSQSLFGVSAWPHPVEVVQPDGTRITIILKGDERLKWAQTADGYSILRNNQGIFEYAKLDANQDMVPSGLRARNERDRGNTDIQFLSSAKKGISYSVGQVSLMKSLSGMYQKPRLKLAQVSGTRRYVCILIGFTDRSFSKTKADFENLLNQVGYVTDGAAGSVYDYYKETSYNQLSVSFTVAGPYVASQNMAYYGANDKQGNDVNPEALVTEAIKLADPDVNYADFDNDKDGSVDGVYVIHAGYGEDSGGAANTIWAHTGNIQPLTLDGKTISDYASSAELRGTSGSGITRIGPICHELGHLLGTMDFYDTNYATNGTYDGTGDWDIMGSGSWNNNGVTPAHHNPYTKIFVYGWATAKTFTSGSNVTLFDAEVNGNSFYRINTATSNEYFLIENRQKQKFDTYIPGHGMIIYHVDGNYISKAANEINIGSHQGMYPVCASATGFPPTTYGVINSTGLPFPGSGNKTSFTDLTIPNSLSWASARTNAPITGITEDNVKKTISFIAPVLPNRPVASVASPATNIQQTTITANWELTATATSYRLDVSTTSGFGTFVNGYNDRDVGNVKSISISGLNPRTLYFYRVRGNNLGGSSDNSNVISFTTLSNPAAAPANLTAISCSNLVTLKWRKNTDPYVRRYRIYGATTGLPVIKMDSTSAGTGDTTKVIKGLVHGLNYHFQVTAVNDDGPESAFSSQAVTSIKTGVIPVIAAKWGDVLICSNVGDSLKSYQWYNNNILIPQATGQYYTTNKLPGAYYVMASDYDGCLNSSNTISNLGLKSLAVYPNPASSNISLRLNDAVDGLAIVSIYNSSGTKVMEFGATGGNDQLLREIPVTNLDEGIYVVHVLVNQKDIYSAKFIVKK